VDALKVALIAAALMLLAVGLFIWLIWTAPVVKRFLTSWFKFLSSSGEAIHRMSEQGDGVRIMRSYMVQHPAKRRRALLGSNPPRNSRCKLSVMRTGRCASAPRPVW
jgi:hypothetical protein